MTRQRRVTVVVPPLTVALGLMLASFVTDGAASRHLFAAGVLISFVVNLVNVWTMEIVLKPRNRPR